MTIADIIQTLRASLHGLTLAELSERAGLSTSTMTKLFSGKRDFRVSTLLALADRLELEVVLLPKGMADVVSAAPNHAGVPSLVDTILQTPST
jgi:transcriptional regulator with XRE-family HTH domain